jgi:hypothetical protein
LACDTRYLLKTFDSPSLVALLFAQLPTFTLKCALVCSNDEISSLISAVVQALPTYLMSCFMFPKSLCDKIEKAICSFWWGSSTGQHKIHWRARKDLFKPKFEGGLGFRDMHLFNKAMLAKQVWRLKTNPTSLLGQCLKAKYFPNSDIFKAQQGGQSSYAWQSIYQAIDTIRRGSCWKIGNGQSINIWEDNWLAWQNGFKTLTPNNGNNNITKVCDIMIDQPYRGWNLRLIDSVFLPFEGDIIKQTPSSWNKWRTLSCGLIPRMVLTGSNLGITLWLIGKKPIIPTLLTLTTTTRYGRSYGPSPLFLCIKLFFGELSREPFLLEVSWANGAFLAPFSAPDAYNTRKL